MYFNDLGSTVLGDVILFIFILHKYLLYIHGTTSIFKKILIKKKISTLQIHLI